MSVIESYVVLKKSLGKRCWWSHVYYFRDMSFLLKLCFSRLEIGFCLCERALTWLMVNEEEVDFMDGLVNEDSSEG